jgi:hypothetical protein
MAAAQGTTAADKRGATTADGMDERCLGGGSAHVIQWISF